MSSVMGVDIETIRGDHLSEQKYGGERCATDGQPYPCDAVALLDVVDGLQAEAEVGIRYRREANEDRNAALAEATDWERRYSELLDHATGLHTVTEAARAFVEWQQKGQPGTPGTLYPFTYAQQDAWHDEFDNRLAALIHAVEVMPTESAISRDSERQARG